ncbi:MAG: helix-turn-helix domain-containing protein [Alphaproteobacteria bacterium]
MNGQFTVIQNKIFQDKRLSTIDFSVLAVLQSMMGVNGYCWPSYEHLASLAHCSRSSAIRSIRKLEMLNYIVKLKGTVGDTNEQSSNRYYINNNPDAGNVSLNDKKTQKGSATGTPRNEESGVSDLHPEVVSDLHPEKDKFFEKNARACARTREGENDTPNDKTESGSLPVAEPDSLQNVNCPKSSEDEDIRLWREVNDEWKRAFKKSLWIFGEVVKTKQRQGFSFRPFRNHAAGFDFDWLNDIFSEKTSDRLNYCEFDRHFADEMVINYDG